MQISYNNNLLYSGTALEYSFVQLTNANKKEKSAGSKLLLNFSSVFTLVSGISVGSETPSISNNLCSSLERMRTFD